MNRISSIQRTMDGWRIEAQTPDGTRLVVFHAGTRREAVQAALWGGGDQAEPGNALGRVGRRYLSASPRPAAPGAARRKETSPWKAKKEAPAAAGTAVRGQT